MRVQDVVVGMEVEYNSKSYQIVKIENDLAFIKGEFIPNTTIKCTIEFPIESLFHSNSSFQLKECPKHGEEILVSNNGNTWYFRTFDGYGKQPGYFNQAIWIFQMKLRFIMEVMGFLKMKLFHGKCLKESR